MGLLALVSSPSALRVATARETTKRPRQQQQGRERRKKGESDNKEKSAVESEIHAATGVLNALMRLHKVCTW